MFSVSFASEWLDGVRADGETVVRAAFVASTDWTIAPCRVTLLLDTWGAPTNVYALVAGSTYIAQRLPIGSVLTVVATGAAPMGVVVSAVITDDETRSTLVRAITDGILARPSVVRPRPSWDDVIAAASLLAPTTALTTTPTGAATNDAAMDGAGAGAGAALHHEVLLFTNGTIRGRNQNAVDVPHLLYALQAAHAVATVVTLGTSDLGVLAVRTGGVATCCGTEQEVAEAFGDFLGALRSIVARDVRVDVTCTTAGVAASWCIPPMWPTVLYDVPRTAYLRLSTRRTDFTELDILGLDFCLTYTDVHGAARTARLVTRSMPFFLPDSSFAASPSPYNPGVAPTTEIALLNALVAYTAPDVAAVTGALDLEDACYHIIAAGVDPVVATCARDISARLRELSTSKTSTHVHAEALRAICTTLLSALQTGRGVVGSVCHAWPISEDMSRMRTRVKDLYDMFTTDYTQVVHQFTEEDEVSGEVVVVSSGGASTQAATADDAAIAAPSSVTPSSSLPPPHQPSPTAAPSTAAPSDPLVDGAETAHRATTTPIVDMVLSFDYSMPSPITRVAEDESYADATTPTNTSGTKRAIHDSPARTREETNHHGETSTPRKRRTAPSSASAECMAEGDA